MAAYGLLLPVALPPPVEVPLDFDSPFTAPGEPSMSTNSSKGEGKGDASGMSNKQQNNDIKPSFISHDNHHHHLNLSNITNRLHLSTLHSSHSRAAPFHHAHSNMHLPHIATPTFHTPPWPYLAWPHIAHPTYAATTSWSPRADVRETDSSYFVEIEVPGTQKEDQVLVQWMTPRTIVVSGDAQRALLPKVSSSTGTETSCDSAQEFVKVANSHATTSVKKEADEDLELKRFPSDEDGRTAQPEVSNHAPTSTFLICERHVGYWRRSFTLPADADLDVDPSRNSSGRSLEYKIEAGVLLITVPKVKR